MGNDFLLSIAPLHEQQNDLFGLLLFSAITFRSTLNGQRAPPTAHYEQDSVTSTRNCVPELVSARLNSSKPSKSFCCSCRGECSPQHSWHSPDCSNSLCLSSARGNRMWQNRWQTRRGVRVLAGKDVASPPHSCLLQCCLWKHSQTLCPLSAQAAGWFTVIVLIISYQLLHTHVQSPEQQAQLTCSPTAKD